MFSTDKCSAREMELFRGFGMEDLVGHVPVLTVYRMCMEKAFRQDIRGPQADSIRRCLDAVDKGYPHRLTPEFDALIGSSYTGPG